MELGANYNPPIPLDSSPFEDWVPYYRPQNSNYPLYFEHHHVVRSPYDEWYE